MKKKNIRKPRIENKYNLKPKDIENAVILDYNKLHQPPFWRNNVIQAWYLTDGSGKGSYDGWMDEYWIGFYDKDAKEYADKIRFYCTAYEDMCVFYKKQPTYNPQKTSGHIRKVSTASHKRNSKQSTNYNEIKNHTYDSTERFPKSVWLFAKDTQKCALTPTQKPVALVEEIIRTYTNEGDTVLDSTAGSMTTGVAAIRTGRKVICIENNKEIFNIGKNRMMECVKEN